MSRKTAMSLVHVRLDEELLERVDNFRFEDRFDNRTRAIRWLLKWALNNSGKTKKPPESLAKSP
jgi:metal-responsive CopG/Arc/MetJ family transcriptional regulator